MAVYAFSDLHGRKDLWNKIKAFLKPEDTVYFLGDAIDRGPDGYEIMKELMFDNRVTYLLGNHEMMMSQALVEIRQNHDVFNFWGYACQNWMNNGYLPTYEAWKKDGGFYEWIGVIDELPTEVVYINTDGYKICMTHAGFTPGQKPKTTFDLVWDRTHFRRPTTEEDIDETFIILHGHTPTPLLIEDFNSWDIEYQEKNGAVIYDNTKIDIDCGSFWTNQIVLLNLDTFETTLFKGDSNNGEI